MGITINGYISASKLLVVSIILAGCGTLTNGGKQSIYVQTIVGNKLVNGIDCSVKNTSGVWYVTASNNVVVEKSSGELVIECKSKDQILYGKEVLSSDSNGSIWTNIFTLGAGAVIDAASGAGFDYPSNIIVVMKKDISSGGAVK